MKRKLNGNATTTGHALRALSSENLQHIVGGEGGEATKKPNIVTPPPAS